MNTPLAAAIQRLTAFAAWEGDTSPDPRKECDVYCDLKLVLPLLSPRWTKPLPTCAGAYWCRRKDGQRITVEVVMLKGVPQVDLGTHCILCPPDHEWAGPLPEPQEPS